MGSYFSLESWAARLGYIVERISSGWVWHLENGPVSKECHSPREVVDSILAEIASEYKGGD